MARMPNVMAHAPVTPCGCLASIIQPGIGPPRLSASRVAAWRGYPSKICLDNGPEFVAVALAEWAERKGIKLDFIEPGRPMQNGVIERFNGSFRCGVLDMHVFKKLTEVREQAELWLADYTREIPHDSLGGLTPAQFRQQNDPATLGYVWSKFTGGGGESRTVRYGHGAGH